MILRRGIATPYLTGRLSLGMADPPISPRHDPMALDPARMHMHDVATRREDWKANEELAERMISTLR